MSGSPPDPYHVGECGPSSYCDPSTGLLSSSSQTDLTSLASGDCSSSGAVSPGKKSIKGPPRAVGRSIEDELCLICGDRASGYHYNALSCEGCKGFFRRSIAKSLEGGYKCKDGDKCEMDMWMRRKCQACRLRRCREVGMKEECLLSTEQCKAREVRRKPHKKKPATSRGSTSSVGSRSSLSRSSSLVSEVGSSGTGSGDVFNPRPLDDLPHDVSSLIQRLVAFQDRFEMPDEADIQKVLALSRLYDPSNPEEARELLFTQLAQFTILATRLIVEYAKHVPGFTDLNVVDEITLLRGTTCENLMLRTARQYDYKTHTVIMADGKSYTKKSLKFAGLGAIVEPMYGFCKGCGEIKMDNAEYALMVAISLFSDRPNLKCPEEVERTQMIYVQALQRYCEAKLGANKPPAEVVALGEQAEIDYMKSIKQRQRLAGNRFAKLLTKCTDLRTLNRIHSDMCIDLKMKTDQMPPLLLDYFSVH